MKIVELNEVEWWIGNSVEECVTDYREHYNSDPELSDSARELTDDELDTLIFTDCDENEVPTGVKRTFREQLAVEVESGGEFPRMFAATEY